MFLFLGHTHTNIYAIHHHVILSLDRGAFEIVASIQGENGLAPHDYEHMVYISIK